MFYKLVYILNKLEKINRSIQNKIKDTEICRIFLYNLNIVKLVSKRSCFYTNNNYHIMRFHTKEG